MHMKEEIKMQQQTTQYREPDGTYDKINIIQQYSASCQIYRLKKTPPYYFLNNLCLDGCQKKNPFWYTEQQNLQKFHK